MGCYIFNNGHAWNLLVFRKHPWFPVSINICWAKQIMVGGVCIMRNQHVLLSFTF